MKFHGTNTKRLFFQNILLSIAFEEETDFYNSFQSFLMSFKMNDRKFYKTCLFLGHHLVYNLFMPISILSSKPIDTETQMDLSIKKKSMHQSFIKQLFGKIEKIPGKTFEIEFTFIADADLRCKHFLENVSNFQVQLLLTTLANCCI